VAPEIPAKVEDKQNRTVFGLVRGFCPCLIDDLQTEASLQNLNIASCTYSLAIEGPPNPKIAGD